METLKEFKEVAKAYLEFEDAISKAVQEVKNLSKEQISKELTKCISEGLAKEEIWTLIVTANLLIKTNFEVKNHERRNMYKNDLFKLISILLPTCTHIPQEEKKTIIGTYQELQRFLE